MPDQERICCLWLDLNWNPGQAYSPWREQPSRSCWVLQSPEHYSIWWPLSPWGLGKCWVLFAKTYSSSHNKHYWCCSFRAHIPAPLWPYSKCLWPAGLYGIGKNVWEQPSFRGQARAMNQPFWLTKQQDWALMPPATLQVCRAPPRYTAVHFNPYFRVCVWGLLGHSESVAIQWAPSVRCHCNWLDVTVLGILSEWLSVVGIHSEQLLLESGLCA